MIQLSPKWAKSLVSQPETGMGYQIVTVWLEDGRHYDRVVIVQGIITSVDGKSSIPFAENEIQRIEVTHDKTPR